MWVVWAVWSWLIGKDVPWEDRRIGFGGGVTVWSPRKRRVLEVEVMIRVVW